MNESKVKVTGVSIEELSATAEWKSLDSNLKRLLELAVQTRNLPALIDEIFLTLDSELKRKIAEDLLRMPAVQAAVNLYALGIALPLPVPTPDEPPVASPDAPIPPVIESGVLSDEEQVN